MSTYLHILGHAALIILCLVLYIRNRQLSKAVDVARGREWRWRDYAKVCEAIAVAKLTEAFRAHFGNTRQPGAAP